MELVQFVKDFGQEEDGVTAIEYGLIAALIAVAIVTVLGTVGTKLGATLNTVAASFIAS